jgi:hypothetical protein
VLVAPIKVPDTDRWGGRWTEGERHTERWIEGNREGERMEKGRDR